MSCETDCRFGQSLGIARSVVAENPQNALEQDDIIEKTNQFNIINRVYEEAREYCRGSETDSACAVQSIIDGATALIYRTTGLYNI